MSADSRAAAAEPKQSTAHVLRCGVQLCVIKPITLVRRTTLLMRPGAAGACRFPLLNRSLCFSHSGVTHVTWVRPL
jgi:hypothetical protein